MKRTYRSKKDTGGALDHKDMILNMDEKSSAFDAFYIQNLKQTKRELSCAALTNYVGTASNKVRKRKFVKRLVKEVEPVRQRETLSTSAYLTPDKSIRVNKILDPFDMLLNSSPAPQEPPKSEIVETYVPKKESRTYVRKRKPKIKKFYMSTDSAESNKENTIDSNVTNIKAHELIIEKVPYNSPKCFDESIKKIVGNLSLINNLKRKGTIGSFNTSYKTRNRLTKNYQSPSVQKSPLCSTPFKEKYRGVSIFNFSPITQKEQCSPTLEEIEESNCSLILVNKSLARKPNKSKVSPLTLIPNVGTNTKTNLSVNNNKDNSIIIEPKDKVQDKIEAFEDQKQNNYSISNSEQSQITETEPFLGFSKNEVNNLTKMMESMVTCAMHSDHIDTDHDLETKKSYTDSLSNIETDENELLTHKNDPDVLLNIVTNENKLVTTKRHHADSSFSTETDENKIVFNKNYPVDSSSNISNDKNYLQINKCDPDETIDIDENATKNSSPNLSDTDENATENSSSNLSTDKNKSESDKNNSLDSSSNENELESNNSSDKSIIPTNSSIEVDKCNTSKSTVYSQSSDSVSLYDTCDSDQSSVTDDSPVKKEPIVIMEKLNDSTFLQYYKKMLISQEEEMSEQTNNKDFPNDSEEETKNKSRSEHSESDEIKAYPIVITDSSTTDDVVSNDEYYNEEEKDEKHVSFVTTRRRNEIAYDSMIQFDQSYGSSSTDCDKTVLSNKVSMNKSGNIDVKDNYEDIKTDSAQDKIVSRKSTRRSTVTTKDNVVSPPLTDSLVSENSAIDSNLLINAKRGSKITGQSYGTCSVSSLTKTDSVQDKIVSRKSTRSSKLAYKSNAISPQLNNNLGLENLVNERISIINTRRGSKISRQSNATSLVSSISKSELSKSPFTKGISKTRKKSRLTKRSNSTSSEVDSSQNEETLRNSTEINKPVVENDTLESDCKVIENRDSISVANISCMLKDSVVSHQDRSSYGGTEVKSAIVLQPGKKWERSLSIYRRMTVVADHFDHSILEDDCKQNKGRKYRQSVISTMEMQEHRDSLHNDSINSRRSTFVSNPGRPTIRFVKDPNFSRVSLNTSSVFDDLKGFLSEECDDTVIELSKLSIADSEREVTVLDNFHETERVTTARDYVLRRCNQTEPLLFDGCYPETVLKNCHKIGEGVYGEVFLWRARDGRARVMKIVPIAGTVKVNGEHQKDFHEIISEIVIAMELSALRAPIADIERQLDEGNDIHALDLHAIENATDIFNEVLAVRCVHGPYPSRLLDLWELYDECKGSENDNPAALPTDQRYIVLELANAGQDLESYQFSSAQQAHALFQQIAFGLAVAEEAFQFEHRDLHWGNVLIAPTEQKLATFVLRGRTYRVARRGVAATVIDYSLSRLTLPLAADCAALYNDLAADDQLFDAVGDYQFEVYRLMRDKLGNDWKNFEPYTNILWLHYTVDKMITALRYKRTNTKIHKHYIEKLKGIKNSILEYGSAVQYVLTDIDF